MQIQHVVREAAFEGAREAASLDATTTTVQTQVNKVLSAGNLVNPTTTITDGSGGALTYSSSTATVSILGRSGRQQLAYEICFARHIRLPDDHLGP